MRARPTNLMTAVALVASFDVAAQPSEANSRGLPVAAVSTVFREVPSSRLLAAIQPAELRVLVGEVLEHNPGIASTEALARAAWLQGPQARALPDPMTGLTGYILPPETRVGPQRVMATLSQMLPWFGKLGLKERAALAQAAALDAQVEARRLEMLTETRRLYYEIAFLDTQTDVVRADKAALEHYEELARTRYATGSGPEQAVIRIQAEITKDESRLLDVASSRATLVASLNALRDRPQETEVPKVDLPVYPKLSLGKTLRTRALLARPELAEADAEIARAEALVDLARKAYRPDVTIGLTYGLVGDRTDAPGIASPPPDNGKDVFGISASLNLPIWRGKLEAGVKEAMERRLSAEERKRGVVAGIDRALGELVPRASLTWDQLHLFEAVLTVQADQSLRSAEAGYSAGTLNSLDLLDAERVLLQVRTATERTRADYAIVLARLEGAVGDPLFPGKSDGGGRR
jgi:cobalt-zinc-cadmium efflux system outer membrane protein